MSVKVTWTDTNGVTGSGQVDKFFLYGNVECKDNAPIVYQTIGVDTVYLDSPMQKSDFITNTMVFFISTIQDHWYASGFPMMYWDARGWPRYVDTAKLEISAAEGK